MADENSPKPGPSGDSPMSSSGAKASPDQPQKDTSPAQPVQAGTDVQDGVQTGGLNYTENEDGTRTYPDQKPVQTIDNPTPQPEQVDAEAPKKTDAPVGQ